MRTLGNLLWLLLAGIWLAIGYAIAGIVSFVLVVTIPFGVASFRLAGYVLWPFGRTVVWERNTGVWSAIGNVIWVVVVGWELAVAHVVAGLILILTVVGIPFGVACWKMVPLALLPLGRRVVSIQATGTDPYGLPHP